MKKVELSRRELLKGSAVVAAALAAPSLLTSLPKGAQAAALENSQKTPIIGSRNVTGMKTEGSRAKVYFSSHIDAEHLIRLYEKINDEIYGNVAIKLHTGEKNGPNILPRDMVQAFQAQVPNSTIVETNTLYQGDRSTTESHKETLKVNGWTFCPVDIMDEEGDVNLPVHNGLHLKEVAMGGHIVNYDSMIVLTHFKGHAMGGFGGSMKNMELMADSAKATCDYFGKRIVFLNVLRRMSVDCDCAGKRAAEPTIPDIGILASTDILAIDQASCDLVFGKPDADNHDLVERIQSRHGLHQLAAMAKLKMGNPQYELISID